MSEHKPWHRRLDLRESAAAYHAFVHFRDLPPRVRSLARACALCRVTCPPTTRHRVPTTPQASPTLPVPLPEPATRWKAWRRHYLWDARAAEWDVEVETEARADAIKAIADMNARHAAIATHAMAKLVERIQTIKADDLSPGQWMNWLDQATTIERRARGQATSVVQQVGGGTLPSDLSALTDDELTELERLLEKASPGAGAPHA